MTGPAHIDFSSNNRAYAHALRRFPEITCHRVSRLDIPMGREWSNIAVNLSGGADSACLAMILCNIIQANGFSIKLNAISYVRCWATRPW